MEDGEAQRLLALAETGDLSSKGALGRVYGSAYAALQALMSEHGLHAEDGQCQGLIKVQWSLFALEAKSYALC